VTDDAYEVYLRPETAQGIYVNFLNILNTSRQKVPFGIAQIGKAFRNEITPKNFTFRTREFEQAEMQFFVKPGTDMEWFEYWKDRRMQWYLKLGINPQKLHFHPHDKTELAHYATAAFDIEYEFAFGRKELEGIHNRTDFDLRRHQEYSKKNLAYFDESTRERFLPYIIETSAGVDRTVLTILTDSYEEQPLEGDVRTVLHLAPAIAPIKAAVFPLVKRDGMPELAHQIHQDLKKRFMAFYDDGGAVGRRYRRQDEAGTPYCITVDSQSLLDQTVTIRDRDSMQQVRVPASGVVAWLDEKVNQ
jgi:glycyl-tRNA synthetase